MAARPDAPREIKVPVSIFAALRRSLAKESGSLPAIRALHGAGFDAGTAAAEAFAGDPERAVLEMSQDAFWSQLSSFFYRRGWGTLAHHDVHAAVGTLSSADWVEAMAERGEDASCSFTTGFLSGLLSALAGGPIAVLEVECRARGDDTCTFAFGNATAVHELYGGLLEGADLHGALATL